MKFERLDPRTLLAVDTCLLGHEWTNDENLATSLGPRSTELGSRYSTVVQPLETAEALSDPFYYADGQKYEMSLHPHRIVIGRVSGSESLMPFELPLGMKLVRSLDSQASVYETSATVDRQMIANFDALYPEAFAAPVFVLKETRSEAMLLNEVIVALDSDVKPEPFFNSLPNVSSYRPLLGTPDQFVVTVRSGYGEQALKVSNELLRNESVAWTSPNFFQSWQRYYMPNDPRLINTQSDIDNMGQWHLHNTGQGGGTVDADSDLPEAWDVNPGGSSNITIAVVDDGVPADHPDILNWINTSDFPDGSDNDGNGWVDDRTGYDFVDNDSDPGPAVAGDAHGTSVAGVSAARGDNGIGVAGAAYRSRVMSVKIFKDGGATSDANIASALYYAGGRTADGLGTWRAADVVNNSWGGGGNSTAINNALNWGTTNGRQGRGATYFFASGNGGFGAISQPAVQSANIPGVIAVGAMTNFGTRSGYSQYGPQLDFIAPSNGGSLAIDTTDRLGASGYASGDYTGTGATGFGGTSSATPLSAGIGALVLAQAEVVGVNLTPPQLRAYLRNATDLVGGAVHDATTGKNIEYGFGKLNAAVAVAGIGKGEISVTSQTAEGCDNGAIGVGNAVVGSAIDVGFRIRNQGTSALTINSVSLPTGAFTLLEAPSAVTLGLGEATSFLVRFQPTRSGTATSRVTISSNDVDEAVFDFDLTGVGLIPSISGMVFEDWDGDGQVDVNDPNLANQLVFLDSNGNGAFDQLSVSDSPALPIPDLVPVTATMNVAGATGNIRDLNVRLNINHTWVSDLVVGLRAPNGMRVPLFAGVGGSGDNFVNTVLDDQAENSINSGFPPFTGVFRPQGMLADFNGISPNGTWTLEILDTVFEDPGTLVSWGLDFGFELGVPTDSFGNYSFLNLPIGNYDVRMSQPANSVSTAPVGGSYAVSIVDTEQMVADRNFGFGVSGRVYGNVFEDVDGDGVVDAGENPAAGRTLFLDNDGDGIMDPPQSSGFANSPNLDIPDNFTVSDQIIVGGLTEPATDINVRLNITHTWVSDMTGTLIGPDGTRVVLFDGVGGSGDNFNNTVFDDAATISIVVGVAPFVGSYRPMESLSAFNGIDANGVWILEITDSASGDTGVLVNWEITVGTGGDTISKTSQLNGNVFFDLPNAAYNVQLARLQGFAHTVPANGQHQVTVAGGPVFERLFGTRVKPPSISGTLFEDPNGNGVFETGESSLAGRTVFLDSDGSGTPDPGEASVVTGVDGSYQFHDLANGTYLVRAVGVTNWTLSGPISGSHSVTISSSSDAFGNRNFGYGMNNRAYLHVFNDRDGDGVVDGGEMPVDGRTLFIDTNGNGIFDASTLQTYTNTTPVDIPDAGDGTALSTITVAGFGPAIGDVNVQVNITHTWNSDLDVVLIAPDGTRIRLFDDVGGSGDNFAQTILDDEAATAITAGTAPFAGSFRPEQPLSILDGMNANGVWTLEMVDDAGGDVGTLHNWSIRIESAAGEMGLTSDSFGNGSFDLPNGDHRLVLQSAPGWTHTIPTDGQRLVSATGAPLFDVRFGSTTRTQLTGQETPENNVPGAAIGGFSTLNPGSGETFTYSLVAGNGDDDNSSFHITGNQLIADEAFDFEAKSSYSIRVRTTNQDSVSFDNIFTITILDGNDAPIDILLNQLTISENSSTSSDLLFGQLFADDQDAADTHVFSLVSGTGDADNDRFVVAGDEIFLKQGESLDFETRPSYAVRVRVVDSGGKSVERELILTIENVFDIQEVKIGDGTVQRSRVSGLSVHVDSEVTIEAGAFEVIKRGAGGGPVDVSVTTTPDGSGGMVIDLAFSGSLTLGGSLVDGNYELRVIGDKIKSTSGIALDADANGTAGGDLTIGASESDGFFRYFGDLNGDRLVSLAEFNELRNSFGKSAGQLGYNPLLDFDGGGAIGAADFNEFRSRFGRRLNFS